MAFTPSRLTLARMRRGLSKVHLAAQIGVATARSVSNYENGEQEPSPEKLAAISRVLGFPVEFFSAPPVGLIDPRGASFRSLSRMTAGERDTVLAAAVIAAEVNRHFEHEFNLPKCNLPDLGDAQHRAAKTAAGRVADEGAAEAAALALRAQWGLGVKGIGNVVNLLEANGVRVFSLSDACAESIDGFSLWSGGAPIVFLNPRKSGERGRYDACHELAHLVLHRHGEPRGPELELEANRFASAFLMPRESVVATAPQAPSLEGLVRLKRVWKVSVAALARRLFDLGLISAWQYRTLFIEISQRGWRRTEPFGVPREQSQILRKVYGMLRNDPGGRARFARSLHIHTADLDNLAMGLAPIAIAGGRAPAGGAPAALRLVDN